MKLHAIEKGEAVCIKKVEDNHLIFLFSGRLHVVDVSENEQSSTRCFVMPGDYFGALNIIDGLPEAGRLIACEKSTYALMPRAHALELIYGNPGISKQVFNELASHTSGRLQASEIFLAYPMHFKEFMLCLITFQKRI